MMVAHRSFVPGRKIWHGSHWARICFTIFMTNIPVQDLKCGVFQRKRRFVAIYGGANLPQIVKVFLPQTGLFWTVPRKGFDHPILLVFRLPASKNGSYFYTATYPLQGEKRIFSTFPGQRVALWVALPASRSRPWIRSVAIFFCVLPPEKAIPK